MPTQILLENWYGPDAVETMRAWPEMRHVPQSEVTQWVAMKEKNTAAYPLEHRQRYIQLRRRLIKALHDGGVGVLLGSDAPQTWNVPGFSIHRELATYVAAGLTPYQALASGTRAVAVHLGTLDRAGTIETGKRADLVLLDGNPLAAIAKRMPISRVRCATVYAHGVDADRGEQRARPTPKVPSDTIVRARARRASWRKRVRAAAPAPKSGERTGSSSATMRRIAGANDDGVARHAHQHRVAESASARAACNQTAGGARFNRCPSHASLPDDADHRAIPCSPPEADAFAERIAVGTK